MSVPASSGATPATGILANIAPWTYALLRVGAGLLFMQHGLQKLFGWFGGVDGAGASVQLVSQMGLAGVLETFGGLLLVLGLLTRPVVLVLAVEMLVAYVKAHLPQGAVPLQNRGELALLYMTIFLFFFAHGGGPMSLGAARSRRP
jgi:putative oxidoreductase